MKAYFYIREKVTHKEEKKVKILLCTTTLIKAGTQRVISNLANYLSMRHDVTIMTCANLQIEYKLNDNINIITLDPKEEDGYRKRGKIYNLLIKPIRVFKRLFKMRKEIKRVDPDIILSFLPESDFLVLLNKKFNRTKVILSVRNAPAMEYKSKLYNLAMRKLYPKADGIVFMTEECKKYFKNIYNSKSVIIPNAVNKEFITKNNEKITKREKTIVSVGRLSKQKNFELLIKAFSELDNRFDEYKLIIYGEGEERKKLEKLIKSLEMSNRIMLPGVEEKIKEKIINASLFVMPSLYEGISNALIEALALGVPTIATDSSGGGSRSLITSDLNGKLIETNNLEALVNAIESMLLDPENSEKMGQKAREISLKLDSETIYGKWEEFIIEVGGNSENKNNII